jgi:hypothetical protein
LGDPIKKDKMGGAFSMGGERRGAYRVLWGNLRERHHFEDLDIDARITLKWFFKKWHGKSENGMILFWKGRGGGLL